MSKPVRIRVPVGSTLEKLVDYIETIDASTDGDWREPGILGELAIRRRMAAEPRLWRQDAEFVRDVVIPRKIASEDGQHVADFIKRNAPKTLDRIASREMDHAYWTAKASERLDPQITPDTTAVAVVMAVYLQCSRENPTSKQTARYFATSERLGVGRNSVRRVVEKVAARLACQGQEEREAFFAATAYVASLIDQHDRGPKHRVRNTLARCA